MKKYELILMKNTLAVALPAIVVFCVIIIVIVRYPFFDSVRCHNVDEVKGSVAEISRLYDESIINVSMTATDLTYTGFDYYVDGNKTGAYYYRFYDDGVLFFLIDTNNPSETIDSIRIKAEIKKDTVSTDHIVNQYADIKSFNDEMVSDICSDFVISEVDYKNIGLIVLYLIIFAPVIISGIVVVYAVIMLFRPELHAQAKQLEEYGDIRTIIKELDVELKEHLIFRRNNIFITDNYMVISYLTRNSVIRLDDIKYLSKNRIIKRFLFIKKYPVYRLTMSNPEKMFYEMDYINEKIADTVIHYIRGIDEEEKE